MQSATNPQTHSEECPDKKDGQLQISGTKAEEITTLLAELSNRDPKDVMGHEALRVLRLLWPSTFRVSSPRPLKIGIDKDVLDSGKVPAHLIKIGLRCYTRLDQYLESTRVGRSRIGLDGKPNGKVRLEEAVNADLMLYARYCRKNPPRAFVGQLRLVTSEEKAALLQ